MTTPRPQPETTPAVTQNNDSSEDKWLVKTPTFVDSFKVEGVDQAITPKGVELNQEQVKLAKAAAKKSRYVLHTSKVTKGASN